MRSKQHSLFDYHKQAATRRRYGRTTHGGTGTKGHRKLERPLDTRKWIHLVLKSDKAKGSYSFLHPRNQVRVEKLLRSKAKQFGVRIAELVNVGNHFHLKVKVQNRRGFQNFLRSVTTLIARLVTSARRGHKFGRFWQGLAFTRVLKSSFEELQLKGYFEANREQAEKSYEAREQLLEKFNRWAYRLRFGGSVARTFG